WAYAGMLWAGVGSPWWIGLLSTLLCAVCAALIYLLFRPLGTGRALVGALAFASTPEVFVSSLSAMDFFWGLALFLGATLCATRNRLWLAGALIGLAIA